MFSKYGRNLSRNLSMHQTAESGKKPRQIPKLTTKVMSEYGEYNLECWFQTCALFVVISVFQTLSIFTANYRVKTCYYICLKVLKLMLK